MRDPSHGETIPIDMGRETCSHRERIQRSNPRQLIEKLDYSQLGYKIHGMLVKAMGPICVPKIIPIIPYYQINYHCKPKTTNGSQYLP